MRFSASLLLVLPVAVYATPINSPRGPILDALFCKLNNGIVKLLEKDASATKYCSSYLSIATSTVKTTQTIKPASVYTTIPVTVTAEAIITSETKTETSTTVTTSTTTDISTTYTTTTIITPTVLTCLTAAYTYTPPVGVVPEPVPEPPRFTGRAVVVLKQPKGLPSNWAKAHVSKACSCLKIPIPSTTTTIMITLPTGTITVSKTETVTPTTTVLTTTTEVPVSTIISTYSTITTSTITAYATATSLATNGVRFRKWNHFFDAGKANPGFNARYFHERGPTAPVSGTLTSLNLKTSAKEQRNELILLGTNYEASKAGIVMNGFFIAKKSGIYTFTIPNTVDNWGYFWLDSFAYAWEDENVAIKARREGLDSSKWQGGTARSIVAEGSAIPITYLWANGGGAGVSQLVITDPDGVVVAHEGAFVQPCSDSVFS